MALYQAIVTSVPVLLATLALGPARLLGLLPHRTARRLRQVDIVSDRDLVVSLAFVFAALVLVLVLVLELDGVWWRAAAGTGLAVTAILVFIAVGVHARDSYDHVEQPVARD